jgi:hypothetical protein
VNRYTSRVSAIDKPLNRVKGEKVMKNQIVALLTRILQVITSAYLLVIIIFVSSLSICTPMVVAGTVDDDIALLEQHVTVMPNNLKLPDTPTIAEISLQAEPFIVIQKEKGSAIRENVKDQGAHGQVHTGPTGSPEIGYRHVDILLPFDADMRTVDIDVINAEYVYAGNFTDVSPVGMEATTDPDTGGAVTLVPEGIHLDNQGRDVNLYNKDGLYPELPIRVISNGVLRQYRYVRLAFYPYRWNPTTGVLLKTVNLDISLKWERVNYDVMEEMVRLSDPVNLADELSTRFYNYDVGKGWYWLFNRLASYDYVIVLPRSVKTGSTVLADFISHKQSEGYNPVAISVESIDSYYGEPELADSIRAFLQDKYSVWGIKDVLLIGDPDPYDIYETSDTVGSVPMKMAWPRGDGWDSKKDGEPCPTDHYYGDLSDDWDLDGDGYAASFDDDYITATTYISTNGFNYVRTYKDYGIDMDMEVRVGRIPFDDISDIDNVLDRTISYESRNLAADPAPGRKRVYLAMSAFADDADYSYLGRQIHNDFIDPEGLNATTLYEPGSPFSHDIDLEKEALISEWTGQGAGMVIWAGHGSSRRAAIRYDGTDLMHRDDAPYLDHSPRSFVFQGSCKTAEAEVSNALAHEMLKNGVMVTIAGTRNSWYQHGQTDFGISYYIGDIGYWVAKSYSKGWRAGKAVKYMRSKIDFQDHKQALQNAITYNLYGDPSVRFKWK